MIKIICIIYAIYSTYAIFSLIANSCRLSLLDEPEQQQAVDEQEVTNTANDPQTNSKTSVHQVTTPAPSNCYGQWSTPKHCNVTAGKCEYHVVWTYSSKTDYMRFTITTTHTNTWTGIGFSDDHKMVSTPQLRRFIYVNRNIIMICLLEAYNYSKSRQYNIRPYCTYSYISNLG